MTYVWAEFMKAKSVHLALEKNIPFVLYRLPGSNDIQYIVDSEVKRDFNWNEIKGKNGFIFYPFDSQHHDPVWLEASKAGTFPDNFEDAVSGSDQYERKSVENPHSISEDEYIATLHEAILNLRDNGLQKFIFSRVQIEEYGGFEHLWSLYKALTDKYKNAFVYLFNHPITGTWMGATPETLLTQNENSLETVSLAGTQPKSDRGKYTWEEKEAEEQQYVSDYIEELLQDLNFQYAIEGPATIEAGPVAHLMSKFRIKSNNEWDKTLDLLNELHPTPAVCGLPKDRAEEYIQKIEKHDRKFYTGYLGPIKEDGTFRMFVNLRCMEIFQNSLALYVGGGITSDSSPESEWKETQLKAETLKAVLL